MITTVWNLNRTKGDNTADEDTSNTANCDETMIKSAREILKTVKRLKMKNKHHKRI